MERFPLVGGMDEVGRGALAGPVTVGLAVVGAATPEAFPAGLADSKLLSARRREELVGPCQQWLEDWALGSSTPGEIDAHGIVGALRLAGLRALAQPGATCPTSWSWTAAPTGSAGPTRTCSRR